MTEDLDIPLLRIGFPASRRRLVHHSQRAPDRHATKQPEAYMCYEASAMKLEAELRHKSEDIDNDVLLDVVKAIRRRVRVINRSYDIRT